jgi:hypothetical protein
MRILVSGSRDHSPDAVALSIVDYIRSNGLDTRRRTFAHGAARARPTPDKARNGDYSEGTSPAAETCAGADRGCEWAARILGASVWRFPADWEEYGKRAGVIRNDEMKKVFKPELLLAFPIGASPGTRDMMERCSKAGIKVHVWEI